MSGSLKVPLPSLPVQVTSGDVADRYALLAHDAQTRNAAVVLLLTLYNEFPLRPEEMEMIGLRAEAVRHAHRGWFSLLERDAHSLALPADRLLAGIALLHK